MIPRLHVVTDDEVLARLDFERRAAELLAAGRGAVALHLRGPRTSGFHLHRLSTALLDAARVSGGRLFVNDRVDVALAVEVDGVQLGGRSLPVAHARGLLGDERLIGASVHSPSEAAHAESDGADFLLVGTIYPTPSHPGRPAAGPDGLRAVARSCRLPLVAIGGVTPSRVREVATGGAGSAAVAHGVAVLRGIWGARAPDEAVIEYLLALSEALGDSDE